MSAISSLSSFSYQASRGIGSSSTTQQAQRGGGAQQAQRGATASTFSSGAARGASGGDTYTCPICGQKIPVGMSHDQFHSGSSRGTASASSASAANTRGQALGSANRAATAYGSASTAGRAPAFNQSATTWAR